MGTSKTSEDSGLNSILAFTELLALYTDVQTLFQGDHDAQDNLHNQSGSILLQADELNTLFPEGSDLLNDAMQSLTQRLAGAIQENTLHQLQCSIMDEPHIQENCERLKECARLDPDDSV